MTTADKLAAALKDCMDDLTGVILQHPLNCFTPEAAKKDVYARYGKALAAYEADKKAHLELETILERPAQDNPALRKLLTEPSIFEQKQEVRGDQGAALDAIDRLYHGDGNQEYEYRRALFETARNYIKAALSTDQSNVSYNDIADINAVISCCIPESMKKQRDALIDALINRGHIHAATGKGGK